MSAPVNLNKVRKGRARAEKKQRADRNAIAYGRTKAEKENEKAVVYQAIRRLDDHKRDK